MCLSVSVYSYKYRRVREIFSSLQHSTLVSRARTGIKVGGGGQQLKNWGAGGGVNSTQPSSILSKLIKYPPASSYVHVHIV